MAATIEMIKTRLARIQDELQQVSAELDEVAATASSTPAPSGQLRSRSAPHLRAQFKAALAELGIGLDQRPMTPEEVQQLMLREGVRPEDRIFSQGIIEAREE